MLWKGTIGCFMLWQGTELLGVMSRYGWCLMLCRDTVVLYVMSRYGNCSLYTMVLYVLPRYGGALCCAEVRWCFMLCQLVLYAMAMYDTACFSKVEYFLCSC